MRERREETQELMSRWETWPLWALGLSNGLNIVLWYVLSMARVNSPELPITVLSALANMLPLIVVMGGIAQALSLDGALIATIAGARHGRRGLWTWLTIVGAGLFSAAISYAVHSGRIDQLPLLHVASAVNLVFYNLHLAQPRKALQEQKPPETGNNHWTIRPKPAAALPASASSDATVSTSIRALKCKECGHEELSLVAIRKHYRDAHDR